MIGSTIDRYVPGVRSVSEDYVIRMPSVIIKTIRLILISGRSARVALSGTGPGIQIGIWLCSLSLTSAISRE
jgi:hypothetical protein